MGQGVEFGCGLGGANTGAGEDYRTLGGANALEDFAALGGKV